MQTRKCADDDEDQLFSRERSTVIAADPLFNTDSCRKNHAQSMQSTTSSGYRVSFNDSVEVISQSLSSSSMNIDSLLRRRSVQSIMSKSSYMYGDDSKYKFDTHEANTAAGILAVRAEGRIKLIRHRANHSPTKYNFWISDDCSELIYRRNFLSPSSKLIFAAVEKIVLGPSTDQHLNFNWSVNRAWLCISLITIDKVVAIECDSQRQFDIWIHAIQALVPLSRQTRFSRAQLLWSRVSWKAYSISIRSNEFENVEQVWETLFHCAAEKKVLNLSRYLAN